MGFQLDATDVAHVSMDAAVREAAGVGARLIALWPLTDAQQMDNDTKYAENLQVRLTRMAARMLTGEDVTVPDAEFVYEGADEIPGRPQSIVDALLTANDAYDEMSGYADDGDTKHIMAGAGMLGVDWDESTVHAVAEALEVVETVVRGGAADDVDGDAAGDGAASGDGGDGDVAAAAAAAADAPVAGATAAADVESVAQRLATVIVTVDCLLRLIDLRKPFRAVPVILYANELCERLAIPRLCFEQPELAQLLTARSVVVDEGAETAATVEAFAAGAAKEWQRHHDDVLWDPDEAKRLAKEEDERRNKEALAAKFAHIKDDPSKETVEL
ncbi:hypothetical protein [Bifidobacterium leontopitheci]|uniref:Uncharacterized protein n=1 Tax=Bifidobacterium leontopitheci TaxID=2650774 RepID=A0A6I1GUS3_9BIFI|nr:hypothetical protein [Bifidobacterium leontopitheci]KAB7790201.1 hypothetical protein F7D09_1273 [Bifidobacterium leontopitheci]